MTKETIIQQFTALAEGRLSAEKWEEWFGEYANDVESICGRMSFLKIKPSKNFSCVRNASISQNGVITWLAKQGINPEISKCYNEAWQEELNSFCKTEDQKDNQKRKTVKAKFSYIKETYPCLFKQLGISFNESDVIEKGISLDKIKAKETELDLLFSAELHVFFQTISKLELEGLNINFDELYTNEFIGVAYLVLGEFWKYGDGDKLLYNLKSNEIATFAHDYTPPKIIPLSKDLKTFIEKEVVSFLKA